LTGSDGTGSDGTGAPADRAGGTGAPATVWFDVEDLFEYAAANRRPSGIQRVAIEILRALREEGGGRVGLLRHDPPRGGFRPVAWASLDGLFERLTGAGPTEAGLTAGASAPSRRKSSRPPGGIAPEPAWRLRLRRLVYRLPPEARRDALRAARLQGQAAAAALSLARALARHAAARLAAPLRRPGAEAPRADAASPDLASPDFASPDFASLARPGDVLVVLGAPWAAPDYAAMLARAKTRLGVRVGLLVFDIIPIRHPEWCDPGLARLFRAWFAGVLPLADIVMAISRATASDVARLAAGSGIALPAPVLVVPMGSGFTLARAAPAPAAAPAAGAAADPALAGGYVLCVGTIEARKNHALLFRVWRRLLDELPRARVPTLVLAGRVGWLVEDLMRQLDNCAYLDGAIRLIEDAGDAELAALYRGCLFTVFPSLYEGWGLPVTESFSFGKPCVTARGGSLAEAGGALARYLDADSASDAYRVIRAVIDDPDGLRAWQAEVARGFSPVAWRETAAAILRAAGGR